MFTFQGRHLDLEINSTGDCLQMGEQSFRVDLKGKKSLIISFKEDFLSLFLLKNFLSDR